MLAGNKPIERSALVRAAVRLIVEETLEAEVSDELGRGYYDRADSNERGHRNGYRVGKLDTAEGRIEYAVPQVRGIEGGRSEVRASLGGKSEELERLAIEMYSRGLSMRDIEAAFTDERGRGVLTRSAAKSRGRALVGRLSSVCQPQFGPSRDCLSVCGRCC